MSLRKKIIGVRYREVGRGMFSDEIVAEISGGHHFVWKENLGIEKGIPYVKVISASKVVNGGCLVYSNCDDNIYTLRVKESDLVMSAA